ncbi:uncharacterized protein LOC134011747 [Osmerus eperlanus]|uniref:uncharacterized protein LOC134011747 n=1 Tax=Osmerus eperlanus TaxID=29151 RepID=UPI002E129827
MTGQHKLLTALACLLFLATLSPISEARRGGSFGRGGRGFGVSSYPRGGSYPQGSSYPRGGSYPQGGQAYRPMAPSQSGGSSAGKVAGAAAAGALGGAVLGSALSRPGYGGMGYGGMGYGGMGYGGYPRYGGGYGPRPGYEGPEGSGDVEYYAGASSGPIYNSIIVIIGSLMALVMGHWMIVI